LQSGKSDGEDKVGCNYEQQPSVYALHGDRQFTVLIGLEKDFVSDWQLGRLDSEQGLL